MYQWNSHGAFVRELISVSEGGDGSTMTSAAVSCQDLKENFGMSGIQKKYIVGLNGVPVQGVCDLTRTAVYLGGDGKSHAAAGLRCDTILEHFPETRGVDGPYWILHPEKGAQEIYCDMSTEVKSIEGPLLTLIRVVVGHWPPRYLAKTPL